MEEIPDYDEKTVDEVKDIVRETDFDDEQLLALRRYETDHKDRVTITRWLDERIHSPAEDDGDGGPTVVTVRRSDARPGHTAGLWFDADRERKTVEVTPRIQSAIDADELEVIERHE